MSRAVSARLLTLVVVGAVLLGGHPTNVVAAEPASTAGDLELAEHWAPVWYQDTHVANYRADYIAKFNYDDDFTGLNNWNNLGAYELIPYVYYWVVETEANWYIGYAVFHPRDWSNVLWAGEHENDMEGCLLVVERPVDGVGFGSLDRLWALHPVLHVGFVEYASDGRVKFYEDNGHTPLLYIVSGGHAIHVDDRAWEDGFPHGDGVVYYPDKVNADYGLGLGDPRMPMLSDDEPTDEVCYGLIDIDDQDEGLWGLRDSYGELGPFESFGVFNGDDKGRDKANAPWGWDDHDGLPIPPVEHPAPEFFVYPAYLGGETTPEYQQR